MATKQTTVKKDKTPTPKAVVNPRDIEWPLDQYGFTTLLRKEGVRAVGRLKGDSKKLEVFMTTLRALAAHAEAKMADYEAEKERDAARAANLKAAREARAAQDRALEVKRLETLMEATKANLEALTDGD